MSSQSLNNLTARLAEVQQLLDAHKALTRFRRAEARAQNPIRGLNDVSAILHELVSEPGRGRPTEVYAMNSAAIALLSGHLQGFVVDLFKEVAAKIFTGKVKSVETMVDATYTKGNPNPDNINGIFNSLGFSKVLNGISWQKMSNKSLLENLRKFNELRNKIVHGTSIHVRKQVVSNYLSIFTNLSKHLDSKLKTEVHQLTGNQPW